jgi:hypothetical protein
MINNLATDRQLDADQWLEPMKKRRYGKPTGPADLKIKMITAIGINVILRPTNRDDACQPIK